MLDNGAATTAVAPATSVAHSGHAPKPSASLTTSAPNQPLRNAAPSATTVLSLCGDSADEVEDLRQRCIRLLATDAQDGGDRLADLVCANADASGLRGQYRAAASGGSKGDMVEDLRAAKVVAVPERPRKVIFLFSGQGGQYVGMGAELYNTIPTFRDAVNQCQALLVSWGFTEMLSFIQGALDVSQGGASLEAEHTAMFTLEYSLACDHTLPPDNTQQEPDKNYKPLVPQAPYTARQEALSGAGDSQQSISLCD
ncbi:hypothetical protein FOMPIDRAFT_1048877 [Fomitopsis schrenkii]|uniref:Malonyl-CoA:ACP transacylase (MAT) domain-containing protein n=1 Tax=Fomitopsis schrenkii TaxID=2126942 RepID=S8E9Y6_FOMSC|nr:hypothetical protein FOMPIDRAFT_1048877 [Fomitopsis schrenkii]